MPIVRPKFTCPLSLLLCLSAWLPAQNNWSWSRQAQSGSSPQARNFAGLTYDSVRRRTVLFGGESVSQRLGDQWEWNGNTWTQVTPTGNVPSPRSGHGLTFDSQRSRVVLFGGNDANPLGDTWEWDGSTLINNSTGPGPSPRYGVSLAYDESLGRTLMFGGFNNTSFLADTWSWDGTTWNNVAPSNPPNGRYGHCTAYDSRRHRVVLFGGYNGAFLNDTWEWDGSNWSQPPQNGPSPAPREFAGLEFQGHWGNVVLFGGANFSGFNDTWQWDGFSWTQITFAGAAPVGRRGCGFAYDQQNGRAVMFGGGFFGDTWHLDSPATGPTGPITFTSIPVSGAMPPVSGHCTAALPGGGLLTFGGRANTLGQPFTFSLQASSWSKEYSLLNPMVRADGCLALDPVHSSNVLFGGVNPAGQHLGDTWIWASGQWTYLPQSVSPSARALHQMTFDPVRSAVTLFGGRPASGQPLGDLWSWDGFNWSQLSPPHLPAARYSHAMARDTLRSCIVLYGGNDSVTRLDDVWEWNGSDWTNVIPAVPPGSIRFTPGPRDGHCMDYSPGAERIVVFGGETSSGVQSDVWTWDGLGWTRHLPVGATPPPRRSSQIALDTASGSLLVHDGTTGFTNLGDLWSIELPVFSRNTSFGAACVGSNGLPLQLQAVAGSTAIVGRSLQLQLTNMPTFLFVPYGMLGLSRSSFRGLPLPLDLTIVGLPGCFGYCSADASFPMSLPNANGISSWSLAIPNAAYLLGMQLYLQGLTFENLGYSRWATASNGLEVRIGNI